MTRGTPRRNQRGRRCGGTRRGGDEIEGGPKELRIGGSGEPSSARNRPAGKRDTTGRLHYRAPTCFLSPRRGLSPLRPTPLSVFPLSSPGRTARFAFLLCMRQPILPSNSVYTNPFRRFPLFRLGHRTQFSSGSVRTLARFSVKRAIPRPTKLPHFFRQTEEAPSE